MNIRNKLQLIFIFAIIVLFLVLAIFLKTYERQNDLIIHSVAEQQAILINAAINVKSDQLDQIVQDYTNWDDIIYYLRMIYSTVGRLIKYV